jgi:hypothetical protein
VAVKHKLINKAWLPDADMKRVILHWTAGGYTASDDDKQHYHFMVEQGGQLVKGHHSVADNETTRDRVYAAHTRMCNTGSIGVAICGMAGSDPRGPFGDYPVTHAQYEIACRIVAELCIAYGIPVARHTVLNHGEVKKILGVSQRGKWDVMVLPFKPMLSPEEVGEYFRTRVAYYHGELARNAWDNAAVDQTPTWTKGQEMPTEGVIAYPPIYPAKGKVTAGSGLKVREMPTVFSREIHAPLRYGQEVILLGPAEEGAWYELPAGFAYAKYIDIIETDLAIGPLG